MFLGNENEKGRRGQVGSPKIESQHTVNITDSEAESSGILPREPDFAEAARFLSMLDPKATSFTFQVFDDRKGKGKPKLYAETIIGPFDEVKGQLAEYNRRGYGIYVTANETNGTGRKKENIVRVRCVWQDLDLPKNISPESAALYWEIFSPVNIKPSIEVETSPGNRQNYFLCDGLSFDDFEGCQRKIVLNHASDKNAADLCRVLRLPGFFHCKRKPFMTRLIGGDWKRHSRELIVAAFPPIARVESAAPAIKGDMPYSNAAEALIRSYVEVIPEEKTIGYQDWFTQGVALARLGDEWAEGQNAEGQNAGVPGRGDIRLELWETLASKSWADTGCAAKWDEVLSAAGREHKKPATFRILQYLAKQAGWTWENSGIDPALIDEAQAALDVVLHGSLEDNFEAVAINDDWRASEHEQAGPRVLTRRASDITPEVFRWVWKYWLARGKLHIIAGVPEAGKTTITMSFAAIISSGGLWPDGTRAEVGNVLIWTAEDGLGDTLIPRLKRMGANLDRIHFIEQLKVPGKKPRPFIPSADMPLLVETAKAIGDIALVIIDPVVAAIPMTRNSHNEAETRNGMQPVVDFAVMADVPILGIAHLTKGTAGQDPLERLNGSRAIGALPRLVMSAAKNNAKGDDEPERIMVRIKSNIGPSGGGFGYSVEAAPLIEWPDIEATRIVWRSPLEGDARDLLAEAEYRHGEDTAKNKLFQATCFLKAALEKGERPQREIAAEAEAHGISEATLKRARRGIVEPRRDRIDSTWYWSLKPQPENIFSRAK